MRNALYRALNRLVLSLTYFLSKALEKLPLILKDMPFMW